MKQFRKNSTLMLESTCRKLSPGNSVASANASTFVVAMSAKRRIFALWIQPYGEKDNGHGKKETLNDEDCLPSYWSSRAPNSVLYFLYKLCKLIQFFFFTRNKNCWDFLDFQELYSALDTIAADPT